MMTISGTHDRSKPQVNLREEWKVCWQFEWIQQKYVASENCQWHYERQWQHRNQRWRQGTRQHDRSFEWRNWKSFTWKISNIGISSVLGCFETYTAVQQKRLGKFKEFLKLKHTLIHALILRLLCTCDCLLTSWSDSWLALFTTTLEMTAQRFWVTWDSCSSTCCSWCTPAWQCKSKSHVHSFLIPTI